MRKEEGNALILYPDAWPVGGRIGTESGLPVERSHESRAADPSSDEAKIAYVLMPNAG